MGERKAGENDDEENLRLEDDRRRQKAKVVGK